MKISKKKPYITSGVTTVKSSSIKGFTRFTGTDEQRIEATPKRSARGLNPPAGTIISTKSSENPKILCFFYNLLKLEGKRYISRLNGGRFILYFLLIIVTPQLKLNYIPPPP